MIRTNLLHHWLEADPPAALKSDNRLTACRIDATLCSPGAHQKLVMGFPLFRRAFRLSETEEDGD
jgi:hypothetical protein